MDQSLRIKAEPLRSVNFAAIGAIYIGIGTRLAYPCRICYIQNTTDVNLFFSLDGVNDHFPLFSKTAMLLDVMANNSLAGICNFEEGQRFYVRAPVALPLTGDVYLSSFYAEEI